MKIQCLIFPEEIRNLFDNITYITNNSSFPARSGIIQINGRFEYTILIRCGHRLFDTVEKYYAYYSKFQFPLASILYEYFV